MSHEDNLVWIDLEMTGLDPMTDSILEIATVVTDRELNVL
ncbi:MAG: exonuclease domain-containing protein, partial [Dietzia cercidiphylli]